MTRREILHRDYIKGCFELELPTKVVGIEVPNRLSGTDSYFLALNFLWDGIKHAVAAQVGKPPDMVLNLMLNPKTKEYKLADKELKYIKMDYFVTKVTIALKREELYTEANERIDILTEYRYKFAELQSLKPTVRDYYFIVASLLFNYATSIQARENSDPNLPEGAITNKILVEMGIFDFVISILMDDYFDEEVL
ncbi:MAG: hypothetical protein FWE37_00770 [Spirochaetaceae bacterium]|nr:hypothetical protein [Spirochaetaceae bacterium]